jgi:ribosomal protein S18 acetylase RimI-like enzyme
MQGIASDLLRLVERRAGELSCRAVYLHVLAQFNAPAIAFYHRHGFWEASLLKGFYKIRCSPVVASQGDCKTCSHVSANP